MKKSLMTWLKLTKALKVILPASLMLGVFFLNPIYAAKFVSVGGSAQVSGDSSLHKWDMKGNVISGSIETKSGNDKSVDLADFAKAGNVVASLSIPVKSLKSGKDGLDDNGYKAMRADQNPNITFNLTSIEVKKNEAKKLIIIANGILTMAGTAKAISFWGTIADMGNNTIKITGSFGTKLTTFKIDPPTAMMGMVTTKDDVTLHVSWNLKLQ